MYNRNLFIADDSRSVLKAYKNIFDKQKTEGYFKLKIFNDGFYLLNYFKREYEKKNKVPLCILDMKMPLMDGMTTASEIRKIDPDVIIIIVTGQEDITINDIREHLKQDIYYIRKPFNEEELYCLVDSLMKGWNKNQEIKKYKEQLEEVVADRTAELMMVNEQLRSRIAEQKLIEQALSRMAKAIEHSGDIIIITDTKGNIQYVNPAFTVITGYRRDEVIGKKTSIFKSGKHDRAFYKHMWHTITEGKVWTGHFVNRKKDGTFYEAEASISPIKNKEGYITNYVAVKRDVTDKLKLEKQLSRVQKMEALGTLAGGIAHDFNNILSGIIGYTELSLNETSENTDVHMFLKQVLKAGLRARELVKQILTFSRQAEHERKPLEIGLIVKEVLKLLKPSLPSTVEIRENIQYTSGKILADPTQIHQVLMNLCTNAFHAMKSHGGMLEVTLTDIDINADNIDLHKDIKEGHYIKLSVSDTGHGMTREILERIFDPYFTTKGQGEGTGLGLSVVHGIVKSYNGEIKVFSEPGKGSTFDIYLPEVDAETAKEETPEPVPGGKEKILIVDDDEDLAIMLQSILNRQGYDVIVSTDGREALKVFRNHRDIDLVITDQAMPEITGTQLAQEIYGISPSVPVILCTGFTEDLHLEPVTYPGIRKFFLKPFTIRNIAEGIREVLNDSGDAPPSSFQ
ncbi:MAG: response regulator [Candidatus Eremiobacterota bacterium]